MHRYLPFLAVALVALGSTPVHAQLPQRTTFVAGSGGYLRQDTIDAMSLTLSVGRQYRLLRGVLHGDLAMYRDGDSPYYRDEFDNGGSACRDSRNGQFADDTHCGPALDFALRAEGNMFLPRVGSPFYLGAGFRLGTVSTPYAAVGWEFTRSDGRRSGAFVRGDGGRDFLQVQVGFGGLF